MVSSLVFKGAQYVHPWSCVINLGDKICGRFVGFSRAGGRRYGSDVCRPGTRAQLAFADGVAILLEGVWPQGLWLLLLVEELGPDSDMGLGRYLAFWV